MEEIYQPSVQRYLQVKSILFNYMGRRLRFEILYNFKEEELEQQKKYLDQKLEQIRWVDNLTGLYNREKYSSLLKDIEIKKNTAYWYCRYGYQRAAQYQCNQGLSFG